MSAMLLSTKSPAGADSSTAQAAQAHFFPSRPSGAALHTIRGTLAAYDIGNDEGGFAIKAGKKTYEVYVAANFRINGREVACDHAPMPGKPRSIFCTDWPSNIVLGKTTVITEIWYQKKTDTATTVMVAAEFHVPSARVK